MLRKFVLIFAILAVVVATAGTTYRITLLQPSVVKGTLLKAGDYKLNLGDSKVTITPSNGKNPVEVPVKVETVDKKFADTVIGYAAENGKTVVTEIRLGGTKTKLVFAQ